MQTTTFIRALHGMITQLKAAELHQFLAPIVKREANTSFTDTSKKIFSELLFDSRTGYDRLNNDPATASLMESLKMADTYDRDGLGRLVTIVNTAGNFSGVWQNQESFARVTRFFSMLDELLTFERACIDLLGRDKLEDPSAIPGALELEIIDYDDTGIDLSRLEDILATLIRLHTDVMRTLGNTDSRLRVRFLDSGSDIRIRLEGAADVVDSIKRLLIDVWKAVRFRKYDEFDRKIESVAGAVQFASTVQEQVDRGVIDPETGNLLKTRALDQASKLVGLGTILAGAEAPELVETRKLLVAKRGTKLLGTGEPSEADQTEQ